MWRLLAGSIALVLLSGPSLAQEPKDTRPDAGFHPAEAVSIPKAGYGDPIFGVSYGTVVLEAKINEAGKIEDLEVRRDIPLLKPHVVRWLQEWTFKPATLDGKAIPSIMTVAVTIMPTAYPAGNIPFPPLTQAKDRAETPPPFQPPEVVSAAFPRYPDNSVSCDTVVLEVNIDETGEAKHVKVVRDAAPFTSFAVDAVKKWKFQPATLDGKPVASQVILAFGFRPPLTGPI